MEIHNVRREELEPWLRLRELLWPESSPEELRRERDELIEDSARNAILVATTDSGQVIGFVEAAIREWAEGCSTRPVGYIEGWYVLPEHRKLGIGRRLIEAAERWALSRGCTEMGSDVVLGNTVSELAHRAIGFTEVQRLVNFSKKLTH